MTFAKFVSAIGDLLIYTAAVVSYPIAMAGFAMYRLGQYLGDDS